MDIQTARVLAENLNAMADQAEAEGRTELLETDLDLLFAGADDALEKLKAAIERTKS